MIKNLRPVAKVCTTGQCPTVYAGDDGTVVIQGYLVSAEEAQVEVPAGECLVAIPVALLAEALLNLI
ncbi:hypothetical protein [Actinoplanes sp. N902-109]|uniref:hypothetical protein n=1 Tax=Actinoplanes sp. (strain N902-109) TaxID=649831 RepID=UPI000A021674|nr:hypothetical protein [Actinoplanes sp. N902-109]